MINKKWPLWVRIVTAPIRMVAMLVICFPMLLTFALRGEMDKGANLVEWILEIGTEE